jgi:translation elongation factor P/translation initiation factor 5A
MSSAEQFRKGMIFRHEGRSCMLANFFTVQSGKQKAAVHIKLCVSTSTRLYVGEEH